MSKPRRSTKSKNGGGYKQAVARSYAPFKGVDMFTRANYLAVKGATMKKIYAKGQVFIQVDPKKKAVLVRDNAPIERKENARGATIYMYGKVRVIRHGGEGSRMFFMVLGSSFNEE